MQLHRLGVFTGRSRRRGRRGERRRRRPRGRRSVGKEREARRDREPVQGDREPRFQALFRPLPKPNLQRRDGRRALCSREHKCRDRHPAFGGLGCGDDDGSLESSRILAREAPNDELSTARLTRKSICSAGICSAPGHSGGNGRAAGEGGGGGGGSGGGLGVAEGVVAQAEW
eukprot:scaffold2502_cov79-Isochrysis_galbana.AAC.1